MLVCWLPYVYFGRTQKSHDYSSFQVGEAWVHLDTEENWLEIIGQRRPSYLKIFRALPHAPNSGPGKPTGGSFIVCKDDNWLSEHKDEVVAIVYFLGDLGQRSLPAEAFWYYTFFPRGTADRADKYFAFQTKHLRGLDDEDSLAVYPPFAVACGRYGAHTVNFLLDEHKELLRRFKANPHDRVVVAVRQYFRAQFSDIFTSTFSNDYATYCSALEAALDIDARTDGEDRFVRTLCEIYGEKAQYKTFFRGLYLTRSLHVHGVDSKHPLDEARQKDYDLFGTTPGRWNLLRSVCRDVILRELKMGDYSFWKKADSALSMALESDEHWKETCRLLACSKAADSILKMSDGEYATIDDLAFTLERKFAWDAVRSTVNENRVFRVLTTCAVLLVRLAPGDKVVLEAAKKLGEACDRTDVDALAAWSRQDHKWYSEPFRSERINAIKTISKAVAEYFEQDRKPSDGK